MMTHIYTATDSRYMGQRERIYAYLITADGSDKTVFGSGREFLTRHRAHLLALTEALGRFTKPCEITIHMDDEWVLNMIKNPCCLDFWEKAGTLGKHEASGLKDWDLWETLSTEKHGKTLSFASGKHEFQNWILLEASNRAKDS